MKKFNLTNFFYAILFLLGCSNNIYFQNQNPIWVLFTSTLSSGSATTNISFLPNQQIESNLPFYNKTPLQFRDENNQIIHPKFTIQKQ